MTHTVHAIAARGFGAGADAYERARPGYPPAAIAELVARLDLAPGRVLLELGAGTGKLTRLLAPSGARILALEPIEAMRAKLTGVVPTAELIQGTAESIPLPAGSVDAVVVAQAFHWFHAVRALSEMHRVLRPAGRVALAFNRRDETVPWVRALGDAIHRISAGEPQVWDSGWRDSLARCALFGPWTAASFRHVQSLSPAGVRERAASVSYVAAAEPDARAALLDEVAAILRDDPETAGRDEVDLPYDTEVLWAERRTIDPGTVGIVASVNANAGGAPKPPVDGARLLALGLDVDAHREPPPTHGGLDGAVCLYAQEAIERVRADGHAAFPGAYGENLTLLGVDWGALAEGDRLAVGDAGADRAEGDEGADSALLELVKQVAPCQTIAHWFVERRIARISGLVNPADARWYARVQREGPVEPGMTVRVVRA